MCPHAPAPRTRFARVLDALEREYGISQIIIQTEQILRENGQSLGDLDVADPVPIALERMESLQNNPGFAPPNALNLQNVINFFRDYLNGPLPRYKTNTLVRNENGGDFGD